MRLKLLKSEMMWSYSHQASLCCSCVPQSPPNNRGGALSDEEALSQIKKGHDTMCVMLSSRRKNLETVRAVWAREDIKVSCDERIRWLCSDTCCCSLCAEKAPLNVVSSFLVTSCLQSALDAAVSMNDLSIVVDILNIINLQPWVTQKAFFITYFSLNWMGLIEMTPEILNWMN